MATTWIKSIHKSGSILAALERTIDYDKNPDKTNGGVLVYSYECAPQTAAAEFLLSKKIYERNTGRNQGKHDVIGYQIRQSFKPNEVTPEAALEIGRKLAMSFTKGRHQFIVAVHTNTDCIHSHIFFNSTTLECTHKFKDFKYSAIALRRISDQLCVENGLSIIENPKLSKGRNYAEYMSINKPPTVRDKLRSLIDSHLSAGMMFEQFIGEMSYAGCEVKRSKHLAFKLLDGKKFVRLDSLGEDYTEQAIRERCLGKRKVAPTAKVNEGVERKTVEYVAAVSAQNVPSMLIDIQSKIAAGAGGAYQQWLKIFNLKQAAKTLIFLQNNGVDSYADLCEKSAAASKEFHSLTTELKSTEKRLNEISVLQKNIGTYGKTRAAWERYKRSGYDPGRFEVERADIILHKAAKNYFDELGLKKLPSINSLKQEYATLNAEKKKLYGSYKAIKENHYALQTALGNAQRILGITPDGQIHNAEREPKRNVFHER